MIQQQIDTVQKLGRENADVAMRSLSALAKGLQTLAVEASDFAKRSVEQSSAMAEKFVGARTVEKVLEIQTEFARTAYESLLAQTSRLGEVYTATAKDVLAPVVGAMARTTGQPTA